MDSTPWGECTVHVVRRYGSGSGGDGGGSRSGDVGEIVVMVVVVVAEMHVI